MKHQTWNSKRETANQNTENLNTGITVPPSTVSSLESNRLAFPVKPAIFR